MKRDAAIFLLAALVAITVAFLTLNWFGAFEPGPRCTSIVDDFGQPLVCAPVTVNGAPACKCEVE